MQLTIAGGRPLRVLPLALAADFRYVGQTCNETTRNLRAPYSIARATLLSEQIERLATQNLWQLAGQTANLDFWIAEAEAAIAVLDNYPARFHRFREAQVGWVRDHGTRAESYCGICRGRCEFGPQPPPPPSRTPSEEVDAARATLAKATRRFLLRLYDARLLDEAAVRSGCDRVGIGVEPEDFKTPPDPETYPQTIDTPSTRARRRGP